MADELAGARIAVVVANEGVEEVELTVPWRALLDAGGRPELIAPQPGNVQAMRHLDKAGTFRVDRTTAEVDVTEYTGLVLPGGVASPDELRVDAAAVQFVRAMFEAGRPAAVVCHGPWTLIEADVVRDRSLTSWPSLRTDIRNAGGNWIDEVVVVCRRGPNVLVTSRRLDDLPALCSAMVEVFVEAHGRLTGGAAAHVTGGAAAHAGAQDRAH
jgi:protease I